MPNPTCHTAGGAARSAPLLCFCSKIHLVILPHAQCSAIGLTSSLNVALNFLRVHFPTYNVLFCIPAGRFFCDKIENSYESHMHQAQHQVGNGQTRSSSPRGRPGGGEVEKDLDERNGVASPAYIVRRYHRTRGISPTIPTCIRV
jgi:hypothetical protein